VASVRARLLGALAGEPVREPVFAAYDWFVQNRRIGWDGLFARGLGQLAHAPILSCEYPGLRIEETLSGDAGGPRRDVRWLTDAGELREWYRGEWRQEYLVKSPADYRILRRALEGTRFRASDAAFDAAERRLGETGVTFGQLGGSVFEVRTPLQAVQIDWAGLERFSYDLAAEEPALMELLELMEERTLEKAALVRGSRARMIKLWENLSIETMGPGIFRRRLVPLYHKMAALLEGTGKGIHVHYDGKLRAIAADIGSLPFAGIDSLTGPPEGDLEAAEARAMWPSLFLWMHPNLGWYSLPEAELRRRVRRAGQGAGGRRYCLMISEEVPPEWERTVPAVLDALREAG
jgi:hypothetical protein